MNKNGKMNTINQIEQHTPEWYTARHNLLTASDVAAVLQLDPHKSCADVFRQKISKELPQMTFNENTDFGTKYEPIARDHYGEPVDETGLFVHPMHSFLGASPDGYLPRSKRLIEIKCPLKRIIRASEVPIQYWVQMQIQMEVCDINKCVFFQCKFDPQTGELKETTEFVVKRNKYWFKHKCLPEISKFWNTVTEAKRKGRNLRSMQKLLSKTSKHKRARLELLSSRDLTDYTHKWIHTSEFRNYAENDPLLDWLHIYGPQEERDPSILNEFMGYISPKSKEFFERVSIEFKKKYPREYTKTIAVSLHDRKLPQHGKIPMNMEYYQETVKEMNTGRPIIFKPLLIDSTRHVYGSPDMLIRDDILVNHFENQTELLPYEPEGKYYYPVFIKFKKLRLYANGLDLSIGNNRAYFTEMAQMYRMIPKKFRNEKNPFGFMMGNGYAFTKVMSDEVHERIGRMNFGNKKYEDFFSVVDSAIQWLNALNKEDAKDWVPGVSLEMCPNMVEKNRFPWNSYYAKLAEQTGELTSVCHLDANLREQFFAQGIKRWQDIPLDTNPIVNKTNVKNKIIHAFVEANQKKINIFKNLKESSRVLQKRKHMEFFVDFETVTSMIGSFQNLGSSKHSGRNCIFLIGMGYIKNNMWVFEHFIVNSLSEEEELRIIQEWQNRMKVLDPQGLGTIYHWSHAEKTSLRQASIKHNVFIWNGREWFDILKEFRKSLIVFHGAFNFKLKSVVKALSHQGLIDSSYDDSEIKSGLEAMMAVAEKGPSAPEMKDVIKYNELDCKVMWEILSMLREKYLV